MKAEVYMKLLNKTLVQYRNSRNSIERANSSRDIISFFLRSERIKNSLTKLEFLSLDFFSFSFSNVNIAMLIVAKTFIITFKTKMYFAHFRMTAISRTKSHHFINFGINKVS